MTTVEFDDTQFHSIIDHLTPTQMVQLVETGGFPTVMNAVQGTISFFLDDLSANHVDPLKYETKAFLAVFLRSLTRNTPLSGQISFPTTFDQFVAAMNNCFRSKVLDVNIDFGPFLLIGLTEDFRNQLHQTDINGVVGIGNKIDPGWNTLGINSSAPDSDSYDQVKNWFAHVLNEIPTDSSGRILLVAPFNVVPPGTLPNSTLDKTFNSFFSFAIEELTTTATISANPPALENISTFGYGTPVALPTGLPSYEGTYNSFSHMPLTYTDLLQRYYNENIQKYGYFIPSQMYEQWTTLCQSLNGLDLTSVYNNFSHLTTPKDQLVTDFLNQFDFTNPSLTAGSGLAAWTAFCKSADDQVAAAETAYAPGNPYLQIVDGLTNAQANVQTGGFFNVLSTGMLVMAQKSGIFLSNLQPQTPPFFSQSQCLSIFNDYLSLLNKNSLTYPLPTTWTDFISGFTTYLGATYPTHFSSSDQTAIASELLKDFTNDYIKQIHLSHDTGFSSVANPLSLAGQESQFQAWFGAFMTHFPPDAEGGIGLKVENVGEISPPNAFATAFLDTAAKYLTTTAYVTDHADTSLKANGTSVAIPVGTLPDFQQVYNGLYTLRATSADFNAKLQTFYNQTIATRGFFVPSLMIDDWKKYLQQIRAAAPTLGSLDPNHSLLVLNRIYALVAEILNTMQGLTAAQASRLTLLSQWQKAYTDTISQLHIFTADDNANQDPGGATNGLDGTGATDLNTTTNSSFRSILDNNNSIVGDDAKAMQSNVNQSNDAVSQQANLATSLIQELSSLLSAIFR